MGELDSERLEGITTLSLEPANGRITLNHSLNETNAWSLNGAFWSMSVRALR
jgi:hypothetical protein